MKKFKKFSKTLIAVFLAIGLIYCAVLSDRERQDQACNNARVYGEGSI